MIEKLDGMTRDIVKDNIEKLKELFPTIVKENKIDFAELELLLGQNISRDKEQYSFVWNGKTEATKLAQKRSTGTLRPCMEESKNWDTTKNIYIEGDNLEVLKLLQSSYNGKIKMIYIDPPYNTGHDFVYKDNFEDNIANYKEVTGQAQKSNADTDGRYHTNWLNMMYPRLKLARNLLKDDGVIFISIDDNEQANLKKICDDVFGENCFIGIMIQDKGNAQNDAKNIQKNHEYILVYSKKTSLELDLLFKITSEEKEVFEDVNGYFYKGSGIVTGGEGGTLNKRPNLGHTIYFNEKTLDIIAYQDYDVEKAKTSNVEEEIYKTNIDLINKGYIPIRPPKKLNKLGVWTWSLEKINSEKQFLHISKSKDGYSICKKEYITQDPYIKNNKMYVTISKKSPSRSILEYSTAQGSSVLNELIGMKIFENPKNVDLIKYLLSLIESKDFYVLDFFSGSATTAQAVMELNCIDNGQRKYICVQLPEKCNDIRIEAGFNTVCDIAKQRIKLSEEKIKQKSKSILTFKDEDSAVKFYNANKHLDLELDGLKIINYSYSRKIDYGFKVFKLDSSNLKKWNNTPTKDAEEVANRIRQISFDYLEDGRTEIDLVYEIMLKYGIDLTLPVTQTANGKGYIVNGQDYKLLVCSHVNIKLEDVEEFVNESVGTYLFADRCFSDDNLLINTQEILKSKNKEMRLF